MSEAHRIVGKGLNPRTVRTTNGQERVPDDWQLLPPGDAALTRRVKAAGPCWIMQEKRGRRVFAYGIWAPAATIARLTEARAAEQVDPGYQRRLTAGRARRAAAQADYVEDFHAAVRQFLAFHPRHAALAERLAAAVTTHATPVGSGTVARTERLPIAERAAAAVIAWLRHQTTGYDSMWIPRVAGRRREVRRELAAQSRALLQAYRDGRDVDAAACPLQRGLDRSATAGSP